MLQQRWNHDIKKTEARLHADAGMFKKLCVRAFKLLRCANLPSLCYNLSFNTALAHKSKSSTFFPLPPLDNWRNVSLTEKKNWLSHSEVRKIFADFHNLGFFLFISMRARSCAVVVAPYLWTAITRKWLINIKLWFVVASFLLLTLLSWCFVPISSHSFSHSLALISLLSCFFYNSFCSLREPVVTFCLLCLWD